MILPDRSLTLRLELHCGQRLTALPLHYEDSANWLWRGSQSIFKLARFAPKESLFWTGAKTIFGLDRYTSGSVLSSVIDALPSHLPMTPVPMIWRGVVEGNPLWEQPWVEGHPALWSEETAFTLGHFCREMQRRRSPRWGTFPRAGLPMSAWPQHAYRFLAPLGCKFPELHHELINVACKRASPVASAIPLLLDFRQDQFVQPSYAHYVFAQQQGCYHWVDWEAMVWAPLEFAWSLYEVLVPTPFRGAFLEGASNAQRPCLDGHRLLSRALLHAMGAFGQTDWNEMDTIDHWVQPN